MIHGEDRKDPPPSTGDAAGQGESSPGNDNAPEPKKPVLGKLKTDEEARLAAEIEKLR